MTWRLNYVLTQTKSKTCCCFFVVCVLMLISGDGLRLTLWLFGFTQLMPPHDLTLSLSLCHFRNRAEKRNPIVTTVTSVTKPFLHHNIWRFIREFTQTVQLWLMCSSFQTERASKTLSTCTHWRKTVELWPLWGSVHDINSHKNP